MISLEDAKEYIRLDYDDEDLYVALLIDVSLIYIDSMAGTDYKLEESKVKLATVLQYKIINDMYEMRSTEIPSSTKRDRIANSILDKLSI